jgi:hypothetical protein
MISVPGTGQASGGSARLHRPVQHSREQVLFDDSEQQRGRKALNKTISLQFLIFIIFLETSNA